MKDNIQEKTVVVGMSGGVDSSVAALLLKNQGYRVIGVFMKNWEESLDNGACQAEEDYNDVAEVCENIGIPFYSTNFSKQYWDTVFSRFLEEIKAGYTPNPDIWCNQHIKFKVFLEKALDLGADYIATGHYCRNLFVDGEHKLARGVDANKDQSYFLYTIKNDILKRVIFPLGGMQKGEVKAMALRHNLSVATKKESMGICFIGKRNFKEFLHGYIEFSTGDFETLDGTVVGQHDGFPFYTIGQRKGLGIGGPGKPWFVIGKDVKRNVVIIEQGEDNPALFSRRLTAKEPLWVGVAPSVPYQCTAKVRYRQDDVSCAIMEVSGDAVSVEFDAPCKAVTEGQSIVFYDGELCLGGAVIRSATQ